MRKNIITIITAFLLLIMLGVKTEAAGNSVNQVFDPAGLLSDSEIENLKTRTADLKDKYKMNFVIVTTDYAEGKEARDYADDFYMDNGFYDNGEKGGVLFLIDMDNREVRLSTAGDMIYYLTDERIEWIIDAGYDDLVDGLYYNCLYSMIVNTESYMEQGIPSGQYTYDEETGKIKVYRSITATEAVIALIGALAAAGIVCGIIVAKYRFRLGTYKYPVRDKSRIHLTVQNDRFVNQVVTTRRIPKDPPPSSGHGGGGSGRSTTHTSSGGGNFGGGGRKF